MTWEAVTAITELVGLTVVVASVIYIAIQTKQTNEHATASSEIEWINAWNQILNSWVSDERTTSIIRRGFYSFEGLEPSEQAVFHMRIGALVNQWVMVRKLNEKNLVGEDIVDEATKVVVATLSTNGGFEFFQLDWKLLPGGAELMDLIKSSKGSQPSLTDLLPWWSDNLS